MKKKKSSLLLIKQSKRSFQMENTSSIPLKSKTHTFDGDCLERKCLWITFKCQVKQFLLTLKTDNRKKDISNLEKVEESKIDSNKK